MRRWLTRLCVNAAAEIGRSWILRRRRRYRRTGAPLSEQERAAFRGYFSEALLEAVRVARVEAIEPALPRGFIKALRLPPSFDISMAAGMAFDDAIDISRGAEKRENHVLFHELVHIAQYRAMGVRAFLRDYLRGWVEHGYDYFAIPLEVQAYQMQDRFERGERFEVEAGIRG